MDPLADRLSERMRLSCTILVHSIYRKVNFVVQISYSGDIRGRPRGEPEEKGQPEVNRPPAGNDGNTDAHASNPKKKPLVFTPGAFLRRYSYLFCSRSHVLDSRFQIIVGTIHASALGRHCILAVLDAVHQGVHTGRNTRLPGRLVAKLGRTGCTGGMTEHALGVVDFLTGIIGIRYTANSQKTRQRNNKLFH